MARITLMLFCMLLIASACKKDSISSPGTVKFSLSYNVDGQPLVFGNNTYVNSAGEHFGVNRLNYYLSYFRFYRNNTKLAEYDTVVYLDANDTATAHFSMPVPAGSYDSIAFFIGIDSSHNIQGFLPPTLANNAMIWPESMGGGYHFIRLEGHWQDTANIMGYTVHIGKNGFQPKAGIKCVLNIQSKQTITVGVKMNINEWFRDPYTYSFNKDGVYSMGIDSLMQKLSKNGADVFTVN